MGCGVAGHVLTQQARHVAVGGFFLVSGPPYCPQSLCYHSGTRLTWYSWHWLFLSHIAVTITVDKHVSS
ncbi:hypothetical protein E2C01_011695 [Portunus trituberculatus]|uniref:Uncharacterized protein n=1 Tax=Portunus trituberculatus TaxID=210409 RepID=A0A5B7DBS0_PORTR|nr:hypothetical protein [Portunus trituberculatus]